MGEELATMKAQVYKDPRPPEYFERFHERIRRDKPGPVYEAVRMVLTPIVTLGFRGRAISAVNVPASGPVILAPHHLSNIVAKSQLFGNPVLNFIFYDGGVFPIRRGHRDEQSFETMHAVLERGGTIVMYAEGGRSRTGELSETVKPGIGRLALESGAPVVPVAIYGSAKARNWKRGELPKVTVQFGEPFRFERVAEPTRHQQQAVSEEIFGDVRTLYAALREHGRKGMVALVRERHRAERRKSRTATA